MSLSHPSSLVKELPLLLMGTACSAAINAGPHFLEKILMKLYLEVGETAQ